MSLIRDKVPFESVYFRKSKLKSMLTGFRRIALFVLLNVVCLAARSQCSVVMSFTQPNCSNSCSGVLSVSLSAACSATPYEVSVLGTCASAATMGVTGITTPTNVIINNVCSCVNPYLIQVLDNSSALVSQQFIAFASPFIIPTANTVTPRCSYSCDGRIQGAVAGTGPFSVSVVSNTTSTGSTTTSTGNYTINNLCAGNYTINYLDLTNGCTAQLTRTISPRSAILPNAVTQTITCNSFSTGAFSVAPTGGVPGYTVSFNPPGGSTVIASGGTVGVSGMGAIPINGTITDANQCTVTTGTTITQPSSIIIVPTQTNINCGGVCIGVASVSVSGGGGTYTYSWTGSSSTGPSASSLCAGSHTVFITDNLNCQKQQTFLITQPASITINPTITNVVCNASCTGAASVTAAGPPPPITFTWLAPPTASVISTTSVITGQCAGLYTLQASATPTCINTFTINITQPPSITLTAITTSVTCATGTASCNGTGSAVVSGGAGAPYTFTWTPFSPPPAAQSGATVNNLCAQNYTLSARDAAGCPASFTFNIPAPPPINFGITTTSVACNGQCTGIINASPSGGSPPYNYTLISVTSSVSSASPVFSNLCPGNYTVRISDASGSCAQQTVVNIATPAALVPAVSITSVTCFNACNGGLSGSATGGTPGYTLSWNTPTSGVVTGGVLTNQCAGNYTFTITDANGCNSSPTVVTLTQPPALSVAVNITNASCSNSCNAVLSATASGGVPGYTLTWSNAFTGNPNVGLCPGNYSLTVTDARSCTLATTASVTAPTVLALTQTVTPPSCAGGCNGSATVTATGGVGNYTFQFSPAPIVTNTTGILSNRCAGNFVAAVTDGNGCSSSTNFSILDPVALSAAITGTRNSCTSCTGASTVTASNGVPPYTFAWTNSVNVSVGTASAVSSLCPGNYTATVTDSQSCTATASVNIAQIVISSAISGGTGIQCFGACTASAVANAVGGQSPYSFSWNTPTAQTTATATNLCAGNYTVTITDSNSPACVSTATVSITQPPDMVITSSQTNLACFNHTTGAISLTVTGGTGAKTFSWSPGGMTTSSVTGLGQGVYTVLVTDANGCTKPPMTFTISAPFPGITAVVNPTNPTNCGTPNNGVICISPSGGNGTFTYTWVPVVAGNTPCASSLLPNTYSIIVGSAGCTNTFFTILSTPNGPSLTVINSQSISCFGGTNGALSFSATGVGPFSFTWTPAVGSSSTATTASISGVPAGTYVLASTDAGNNCVTTVSFVIPQPSSITVNATVTNVHCNGPNCDGSITVAPSGGTPAYTFNWAHGPTSAAVTTLCQGGYTVNVLDQNNCPAQRSFSITVPPAITIASTVTNIRCFAACNGSIVTNATGGTGPLTYSWLPVGAFTGSSTATVINLCPNIYTLVVTDGNSCTATAIFTITEPPQLTATLNVQQLTCANVCDGAATLTAGGGVPTYSFAWTSSTVTASSIASLCSGNYTGTVIDGNGCMVAQGFTLASPAVLALTVTPSNPKCFAVCNGSFATTVTGNQGAVNYSWTPAGFGPNPTTLCDGNYTLTITDAAGCQQVAVSSLVDPPLMLANITATPPTCNGICDGIAVSSPSNAVGAVSYTWVPSGPNSATNTAVCGNSLYTVTMEDANNCVASSTFIVTAPPSLSINASLGPATCGNNNGSITAAPIGGTPNYTFMWSSPNATPITTTGSVVTNLAAGIYTVQLIDANLCFNTITIPLSNSNGPRAPITSTNAVCNGTCTGAASVGLITSGTSPYATPVWIQPLPTVAAVFIGSLCAGNYTVELRDANNCLTYTGTTITEPPPISIQPSLVQPLCQGVCNGTIAITTTGGIAPYTYTWIPGSSTTSVLTGACAGTQTVVIGYNSGSCTSTQLVNVPPQSSISISPPVVSNNNCFGDCLGSATISILSAPGGSPSLSWSNGQTGNFATGLCSGTYSVLIVDAQGCNNTFSVPVTSPTQLGISSNLQQPDCGFCNGSATVTGTGGTGPSYTYSWTSGATGSEVSNLCAGLYQVEVTDMLNCRQTVNFLVNNSTGITGETVTVTDVTCPGPCNGAATVTAIGGNAPITYSWTGLSPSNTSTTAANLCAGVYFVQMTDAQGCLRTTSLQVDPAVNFTIATFVTAPVCGTNTGFIQAQVTGGTPAFSYTWLPGGSNAATLTNVDAGTYTLVVNDQAGAGCAQTTVISVSNPNGPTFSATQQDETCATVCDGQIALTSTFTPAPTFTWSTGSNAPNVTGLCPGLVSVTVSSNGCRTVRTFSIGGNPAIQIAVTVEDSHCAGDSSGAVNLLPTGGVLPYTFSWTPNVSNTGRADSLGAGVYSVTILDANNCPASFSASVSETPEMVVTPTVANSSCGPIADGSISISVTGGTPTFTFAWTGPNSFSASTQQLNNVAAGTYTLSLVDALGCVQDTMFTIAPTITLTADAGPDFSVCPGSNIVLTATNSQGAVSYNWLIVPQMTSTSSAVSFTIPNALQSQTFQLLTVSTSSNCTDTDLVVVNVYPTPYLEAGPSHTIPVFSTVTIGGNPTATGPETFTWSPGEYLSDMYGQAPVASNTVDITYTVSMMYGAGCLVTDTMQVLLYPEIKLTSGFSPNNDGKNDKWIIDYIDQFPENTVEIYNRWGERLFYSKGYENPFDGTYHGQNLPVGTYYYVIHLNHPAYTKPYTGPLTIFR
jgi:gliding motility-associated-like protein